MQTEDRRSDIRRAVFPFSYFFLPFSDMMQNYFLSAFT